MATSTKSILFLPETTMATAATATSVVPRTVRTRAISSSSSPTSTSLPSAPTSVLPLRSIPGSYGLPLLGPLSDRLDYFWFQGPENFFKKRIDQHKSTVFRTNVPPSFPFFAGVNPNVVAVLDCKSFAHLFDMELVEKKDVLVGEFVPSLKYTGDTRVGVYMDPTEPKHAKVKKFSMDILKRSSKLWIDSLLSNLDTFFSGIESDLSKSGSANYIFPLQRCLFNFLTHSLSGADPTTTDQDIADSGYAMLDRWLAFQLLPIIPINVIQPLEEIFLHSFAYPSFIVSGDYRKLSSFIETHGDEVLQRGVDEFGLTREEALHNLLFILGFNAFGGFSIFLLTLINTIASDKSGLQDRLREEVRSKCGPESEINFESVKGMDLVNSMVYETLRLNPPVPQQFARARKDFRLRSHEAEFEIKKGELLCGYQPLAMKDGKVFDEPESFKPDRFTGDAGAELLNYLYWSNGPQTGTPSESNKQCAAKDYVTLTASLIVAYIFRRYDSLTGDSSKITAVVKKAK